MKHRFVFEDAYDLERGLAPEVLVVESGLSGGVVKNKDCIFIGDSEDCFCVCLKPQDALKLAKVLIDLAEEILKVKTNASI